MTRVIISLEPLEDAGELDPAELDTFTGWLGMILRDADFFLRVGDIEIED